MCFRDGSNILLRLPGLLPKYNLPSQKIKWTARPGGNRPELFYSKSKMLLQVHDELVFDVHNDELEKIQPMIKYEMENAFIMTVPLDVEIGIGKDWLEAH